MRRATWRCRCGKMCYGTYKRAASAAQRLPVQARPYYCTVSGAYHISSGTQADYDRRQAQFIAERKREGL